MMRTPILLTVAAFGIAIFAALIPGDRSSPSAAEPARPTPSGKPKKERNPFE